MATAQQRSILLTYDEVAAACRVKPVTVRSWVHRGQMKAEKNGPTPRIPISELSPTAQTAAREIVANKEAA